MLTGTLRPLAINPAVSSALEGIDYALQILNLMQFEIMPIIEALAVISQIVKQPISRKQLFLFD
jgi:hypothetical protein